MNAVNNNVNNVEHFDVLVVGAGLSGIGSAYHLKTQLPDKSFCVLDGMESFGGTWLTHNYPGVRSDSDLFTFGYRFKPWTGSPIANGAEILKYMGEVIADNHIDQHIRYNHHVLGASWDSVSQLWTITAFKKDSKETVLITAHFLWMCQGYYNHEKGYTPDWNGRDDYQGLLVHPQDWPKDLHYKDKKVVIIGSGATAATLAPNIAEDCEHVTLLQRSPTYFIPRPTHNPLTDQLREIGVDDAWIHEITRKPLLQEQAGFIQLSTQ